jgi:pSer/pThr/pTyr-binding forkhead associated (FHA) protein
MKSAVGVYKIDYDKQKEDLIGYFDDQAFIGQSPNADIIIEDYKINGIHALIERVHNEYHLTDLGSNYGTFQKNKRIQNTVITEYEPFRLGKQVLFLKDITDKNTLKQLKLKKSKTEKPVTDKIKKEAIESSVADCTTLQVTLFWGDKILELCSFEENSTITIGTQKNATFILALDKSENLSDPFPLGRYENGTLILTLPVECSGIVWIDNQIYSVDTLRHFDSNNKEFGQIELKLKVGSKAHIHFGELSLNFRFIKPTKPIAINWFAELDSSIVKITIIILILLMSLFISIQLTPQAPEPVKTLADIPQNLKRILFDSGSKEANKKQRAAIGQLAKNLEGGRESGDEGRATGSSNQSNTSHDKNPLTTNPKIERTIGITKNPGLISSKKSGLDIDSVFATNTKSTSTNDNNIPTQGPVKTGNIISKLVGNNYGKSSKGVGTGGGGKSVGIGQLKGNRSAGGMGHGDSGLIPSKGLEINSNSQGNGGSDILVVGGLDSDIIAGIIKRYLPQIQNCYEQQLVISPSLNGKVTVAFIIGPDGSVKNQSIAESSLNNQPTEKCMLDKIRDWKFPKPRGGGTVGVKYPLLLMSSRAR